MRFFDRLFFVRLIMITMICLLLKPPEVSIQQRKPVVRPIMVLTACEEPSYDVPAPITDSFLAKQQRARVPDFLNP